jgi:hypothetical protein
VNGLARITTKEYGMKRLFQLQAINAFGEFFSFGFFYMLMFRHGIQYANIVITFVLLFLVSCVSIATLPRYNFRKSIRFGLLLKFICYAMLVYPISQYTFLVAAIIYGLSMRYFWVPYNGLFLAATQSSNRATSSTRLFAFYAVFGAVFPWLGGILIERFSYSLVFSGGAIVTLFGIWFVSRFPPAGSYRYVSFNNAAAFKKLAGFVLPEGMWQGVIWMSIPLSVLFLRKSESVFGLLLAFLSSMGGLASLIFGVWSDRKMNRRIPLLLSAAGATLFTFAAIFLTFSMLYIGLAFGAAYFCIYTMYSFTFTICKDLVPDSTQAMATREVMLTGGRVIGGLVVLCAVASTQDLRVPLAFAAFSLLILMLKGIKMVKPSVR